ncbi:MAG: DNA repair protein RecO [Thermodesulforhabdaceae bacterium]|jgi:DNA repair protein RecO
MFPEPLDLTDDKSTAIVVASKELEGADLLVFFLDQSGTLRRGIAKNAKKSVRRFLNCFEPLNIITLSYVPSHSHLLLKEARLHTGFTAFRQDPMLMGIGNLISEVLLAFLPENDAHAESFLITATVAKLLNEKRLNPLLLTVIWLFRLMVITGHAPDFNRCAICNTELDRKRSWVWQLNPLRCVCADHYLTGSLKWEWDKEVLMFLRSLRIQPADRIWRFRLSSVKCVTLLKNLCHWCETILQRELKSYRWLERVVIKPAAV